MRRGVERFPPSTKQEGREEVSPRKRKRGGKKGKAPTFKEEEGKERDRVPITLRGEKKKKGRKDLSVSF